MNKNWELYSLHRILFSDWQYYQQDSIPVGCILPARAERNSFNAVQGKPCTVRSNEQISKGLYILDSYTTMPFCPDLFDFYYVIKNPKHNRSVKRLRTLHLLRW